MRIRLFAPAPWQTVSGGYVYDRAMVGALRAAGHEVAVVALGGAHPLADATALREAAAAWAALPDDAVAVIDGLCLPAFSAAQDGPAWARAVGLIHHPTALETGRTQAARDALRMIETAMFPRLARLVVTSADTAERVVSGFGAPRERVAVVEPGTPMLPRSPGPTAPGGCAILAVASLIPRKGHDVLLRALARLPDLDWRLTIAGAGPDPEHVVVLNGLAAELGIAERVTFAGELDADALEPLWHSAGLFASATHYEGYGMAIAEALRRGLPVAVTSGGAAAALVTPDCAVVCPPGDHEGLSRAIRRVVFDRALRAGMAQAAWRVGAALPDWPAQAARLAGVLTSIMEPV